MRVLILFCGGALIGLGAIGCSGKDGTASFGDDTGTTAGDDTSDGGGSDDTGPTGPQVFPDEDPLFEVDLNGSTWSVDPKDEGNIGYYTPETFYVQESTSSSTATTVSVQIDGDLGVPGTYPVTYISYTFQVAQDPPTVADVIDPPDFNIVVKGYSETGYDDGDFIYAVSQGTTELSDGREFTNLEATAFPNIYAR